MKNIWKYMKEFVAEEDAVGVVEIILILVVLISLVIIFKEQLTSLVKKILSKITKQRRPAVCPHPAVPRICPRALWPQ